MPSTKTCRLPASRVAEVATKRTSVGPVLADLPGVVRGGREGPVQGFLGKFAGGVHALAEPDDAHFAHDVGQPGRRAVRFRRRR